MKKIVLIVFFAITIVSCKKEAGVSPAVVGNASYDAQVAALIQKADKDLYNQMYNPSPNQKFPIISIKSLPGIFYIPAGGIDNATCWPSYNVCMVIVSASKMSDPGQPQTWAQLFHRIAATDIQAQKADIQTVGALLRHATVYGGACGINGKHRVAMPGKQKRVAPVAASHIHNH